MRMTSPIMFLALGLAACGEKGDPGDDGADGATGATGETGADGAPGTDGDPGDDAPGTLVEAERVLEDAYGCDQGYEIVRIGVDDGAGGGTAEDGVLQDGEVLSEVFTCLVPDLDEDDIWNLDDNCVDDPNYEQEDADFDGQGDACDGTADAATMYAISRGNGSTASTLYSYDAASGTLTEIGSTGHALVSLQVNPADGRLYATVRGASGRTAMDVGGCDGCLVTIDPSTGTATQVSTLDVSPVPSLAFLSDGTAFGWTEQFDGFIGIDTASGTTTDLEIYQNSWGHSMGADARDNVYWMNGDGAFYAVDRDQQDLELLGYLGYVDSEVWSPPWEDYGARGDISADGKWWLGTEIVYGEADPGVVVIQNHPVEGPRVIEYRPPEDGDPDLHQLTWSY